MATPEYNINKKFTYTDSKGKTYNIDPASEGGYMKQYSQYEKDATKQFNTNVSNLDKTLAQNNEATNTNYDNSARQAYTDYMRKQKALPSQLNALGVRGGATESGLLNLYNNYGISHSANEQQRNADLTTNKQSRDDAYNTAYNAYLADLSAQKLNAWNNQQNEYNNEITRFSSTVAQYPTTKNGYESYKKWYEAMANSNDPLKETKCALIRQQMATQFPEGAPTATSKTTSSGSGGSGSYGGSYSTSTSATTDMNNLVKTLIDNTASTAKKTANSIPKSNKGKAVDPKIALYRQRVRTANSIPNMTR